MINNPKQNLVTLTITKHMICITLNWRNGGQRIHTGFKIHCSSFESMLCIRIPRIRWTEHWTDEPILEEMGTDWALMKIIQKRKLTYFGHIVRAQNLCKKFFKGRKDGRKSQERARLLWMISGNGQQRGIQDAQPLYATKKWRELGH